MVDFSKLNAQCECKAYPIPRVDDMIDEIGSARYLTKRDITKAYWNICLEKDYIQYTGFVRPTPDSHYENMPMWNSS